MYNSDFRTVSELTAVMSVYGSFDPFEHFVVGDCSQMFANFSLQKQTTNKPQVTFTV